MEFDEQAWIDRVRQAKSSEELRALAMEIPLDFSVSITAAQTKSPQDSTSTIPTEKTPDGSETASTSPTIPTQQNPTPT